MKLFLQSLLQVPLFSSQHAALDGLSGLRDTVPAKQGSRSPSPSSYQGPLQPLLNTDSHTFINEVLSDWDSPGGVGVAVVRKDEVGNWLVETKGYGVATAKGDKVDEDTLFSIGSNSKLFTAITAGVLIHNHTTFQSLHSSTSTLLSWDTRLKDVIPGFDLLDKTAAEEVTILDALSHRTGLAAHDGSPVQPFEVTDTIEKIKHLRSSRPFRDTWQYNNLMYQVVSYLPTALLPSKPSFAKYVKENIFDPLNLASTTYSYEVARKTGKLSDGFGRDKQVRDTKKGLNFTGRALSYWNAGSTEDGNGNAGDGGVLSSTRDMAKWLQTLLLLGTDPVTNSTVIPKDVIEKVSTGVTVQRPRAEWPEMSPTVYGMGQERGSYRGVEWVEHTGGVPGFKSVLIRLPKDNVGVAVLVNDEEAGAGIVRAIQYYLIDKALGLEPVDWHQRYKEKQRKIEEEGKHRNLPYDVPGSGRERANIRRVTDAKIWALEGQYNHPGYGSRWLCVIHPSPVPSSISSRITGSSTTNPCSNLRASVRQVLPGLKEKAERENVPTLVANWDNPFLGWVVFRDLEGKGKRLNMTGGSSYPTDDSEKRYWILDNDETVVEGAFADIVSSGEKVNGLGVNGIWGGWLGGETTGEGEYEVFFDKI